MKLKSLTLPNKQKSLEQMARLKKQINATEKNLLRLHTLLPGYLSLSAKGKTALRVFSSELNELEKELRDFPTL